MRSETEVSCSCGLVSERVLALTPTTLSVLQPAVNISAPKCIATSIPGPPNFASPSVNRPTLTAEGPCRFRRFFKLHLHLRTAELGSEVFQFLDERSQRGFDRS